MREVHSSKSKKRSAGNKISINKSSERNRENNKREEKKLK